MPDWKQNWPESRERLVDWWNRKGVVRGKWTPATTDKDRHAEVDPPPETEKRETLFENPGLRAQTNHYILSRSNYRDDVLPIADTDIGPGSLCLYLGCEPRFGRDTVWFDPCWEDLDTLDEAPSVAIHPDNHWWKLTLDTLRACKELGGSSYLVGCPDLVEHLDILSSMREPQMLMMDMIENPDTVHQKLNEITQAWFTAYDEIYKIIREPDGSSAYGAFRLWGPGKTAKLQCDASAMISPAMFREFVQPHLKRQCAWLDHSLYHLDGTQAVCHLDALLEVEELDAIEWTPQAGIEPGTHPRWFPMYRKILKAGKCIQVICPDPSDVDPLLEALGQDGIYLLEP